MKKMPYNKYLAELLGAFSLTFAVSVALSTELPLVTPLVAALTLGLFVYTIGSVSGAHLNPAITLAMMSVKKICPRDAAMYILAQLVGAGLSIGLIQHMFGAIVDLPVINSLQVGVVEGLGAAVLAFGVAAVTYGKVHEAASGITVGWSLLLGLMLTAGFSNGVLNPAVALGLGSVSFAYVLGPIVGALLGVWLFKFVLRD